MSGTVGERLVAIELDIKYIKHTTQKMETAVEGMSSRFDTHMKAMKQQHDDFITSADKRYADKKVERLMYALISLILMAVIAAILKLVILT